MPERALTTSKSPEAKQTCSNFCKQKPSYNSSGSSADRILQLQRTAGNQAVQRLLKSRTLQAKTATDKPKDIREQVADKMAKKSMRISSSNPQLRQPIVQPAPKKAIGIRDFINMVEIEERKWPVTEQIQTALMITRLRKLFYGTPGWDKFLIPKAAGISPGYDISEQEIYRENLSLSYFDTAEIVRTRQVVTDASGKSPAIASQQEVRLEDGTFSDIGHVLTGLDAANNPSPVSGYGLVTAYDNKAAVTWTGDIGSSIAEIIFRRFNNPALSSAEAQLIINDYAPAQDMLGDIDSYIMAYEYNISNSAGKKVSELLRAYYLSSASTPDGRIREHRYSHFCELTGLTGWNSSTFANEEDWIKRWAPEVGAAAALYVGANTKGIIAIPSRLGIIWAIKDPNFPLNRYLLRVFLDALKVRVAAEPR